MLHLTTGKFNLCLWASNIKIVKFRPKNGTQEHDSIGASGPLMFVNKVQMSET